MRAKKSSVVKAIVVKTLVDIQGDMSGLYEEVREGTTDLKTAECLANIAGKFLKAEQLKLAREMFISGKTAITRVRDDALGLVGTRAIAEATKAPRPT